MQELKLQLTGLVVLACLYVAVGQEPIPLAPSVRIKFVRYENPTNMLITGANCDPFQISKCDPYFSVVYGSSNNA